MNIDLLILLVSSSASLLLGLIVVVKNPSKPINQKFGLLALSLTTWSVFNYLADHAVTQNLLFTRLTFLGGVMAVFSVLLFIRNFPSDTILRGKLYINLQFLFSLILVPIVFLPDFVPSVTKKDIGISVQTGMLYPIFLGYLAYSLFILALIIIRQYKAAINLLQKQQVKIISEGIVLYAVFAITSNVLLPEVIDNWSSSRFGPAFTLFLIVMSAYAIVKHRMFDIQAAIARSVAYVLVLGTIALFYAVGLFGIIDAFFGAPDQKFTRQILSIALLTPLVLSFQTIKSFFDRVSNKVFYRDNYDVQEVLDKLSSVIVAEINLNKILNGTRGVISEAVKSSFIEFVLIEDAKLRLETPVDKNIESKLADVSSLIAQQREEIIVREELDQQHPLRGPFAEKGIAVSLRLNTKHQNVGFILFGDKKNGNIYARRDIKLLSIAANELSVAIQNALRFEEIQRFNVTLQQKIEEATRELRKANTRLKELDASKDEFISMASHQLRTPLTAIKGYLSLILDGDMGPVSPKQKDIVKKSFDGAQRMVYLIADLLNVSRLQTGKFVIENKPTNLADLVEGEISQLATITDTRKIKLNFKKPQNFPTIMLDEDKIRQVVMNFLDNAVYYTPSGGDVRVELTATDKDINFTVTDTGVGVPKEVQHNLFSKFYRAENARKMRPDGTGLGLYMAKKVVTAEGGAIIFKSELGKGSTFGFTFPRQKAPQ